MKIYTLSLLAVLALATSCKDSNSSKIESHTTAKTQAVYKSELPKQLKDYWYEGKAEVTSYSLSQARYGQLREGKAVLIFVTEPFNKESNTKADRQSEVTPSVLKLNFTKNFNTGIYPYSMMTSSFYPVDNDLHSYKVSSSSQEWCGHTYMELTNREKFDIDIESYFEGESTTLSLAPSWLEDDIWSHIRLRPDELPLGEIKMIPSFFYLRLKHKSTKAYTANASVAIKDSALVYTITYPELKRTLIIEAMQTAPYEIIGWEETYPEGSELMTTKAQRIKKLKIPYWQQNANRFEVLRDSLGL